MRLATTTLLVLGSWIWTGRLAADHVPVLPEDAKLLAADGASDDWFGEKVAVDGDTVVVGVYRDDDLGAQSGAVYVFERGDAGSWAETAKLVASDGESGDVFGVAVGVHRDHLVVGALDDDLGDASGSAYVFERSGEGVWLEVAKLHASDGDDGDWLGESVAIHGGTIVVGAEFRDDFGFQSGAAYVFERGDGGEWVETAKLLASDGEASDAFGCNVATDGARIVVGARGDDDNGESAGAAYVFERSPGGGWVEVAKLVASDGEAADIFGTPSAIDGDVIAVGAVNDDDRGFDSGAAYVFERDAEGTWVETAKLHSPHPGDRFDGFGRVALRGHALVVGATGSAGGHGSADLFRRTPAGEWVATVRLLASDIADGDQYGIATAFDGETAVVGARLDDDLGIDSGSAYVFSLEECRLELRLEPKAVPAGGELRVGVLLEHNRPDTVTVPLRLWVEDAAGRVVAGRTTEAITFHHGDGLRRELTVEIPAGTPPGDYRVLVGIERMQQGLAAAVEPFRVLGPGTVPRLAPWRR